jgi:DNA-binding NarL/FixJ family response regulator
VERPEVGRRVLETYAELSANNAGRNPPKLTERELSILSLAAQGQTNQQIGKYLGVSEHTVKSAISLILARLGLRHRTEAVVHALRNGWITMPSMTENPAVSDADGRYVRPGF